MDPSYLQGSGQENPTLVCPLDVIHSTDVQVDIAVDQRKGAHLAIHRLQLDVTESLRYAYSK